MIVRRRFTPDLKARVVLELISGAINLAETCRHYDLSLKSEVVPISWLSRSFGALKNSSHWQGMW